MKLRIYIYHTTTQLNSKNKKVLKTKDDSSKIRQQ